MKSIITLLFLTSLFIKVYSQNCDDIEAMYISEKHKKGIDLAKDMLKNNPNEVCALKLLIKGLNKQKQFAQIQNLVLAEYEKNKNLPPEVLEEITNCLKWKDKVGLEKGGLSSFNKENMELMIPKIISDTNMTAPALYNLFYYLKTYGYDTRVRPLTNMNDRRDYNDIRFDELMKTAFEYCQKVQLNDPAAADIFDFMSSMVHKDVAFMKFKEPLKNEEKQIPNDTIISSYFSKGKSYYGKYPNNVRKVISAWDNSIIRDSKYFNFIQNKSIVSDADLKSLFSLFSGEKEKFRAISVLDEIYSRNNENKEICKQLLDSLSVLPDDMYVLAANSFGKTIEKIKNNNRANPFLKNEFAKMLIRHKNYLEAHDYLVDEKDLECKMTFFRAKLYVKTFEDAFGYAIQEKLPNSFIAEKLNVAHNISSSDKYLKLFYHLVEKYPSNVDSIQLFNVGFKIYDDLGVGSYNGKFEKIDESEFSKVLKIYTQKKLNQHKYQLEYSYWYIKKPTATELTNLITKKMISTEVAGWILKNYGHYYFERQSMAEMGHEGIKKALEFYHMAEKYLKCDQDLLDHMFVSYDIISKGAIADTYGVKLVNCGFSTAGLRGGGGKVRGTGSRGGKFYINKNGNKTYVND